VKVPLLDLQAQFAAVEADVRRELDEVFATQQFILGPKVERLERELAAFCRTRFAVGVSSGTDALLAALMALGVGAGDEVVTTPYTFFATVGAIARLGARPAFADVDARTMNLDADAAAQLVASRPRVKAVVPVHLFGRVAELAPLERAAKERGVPIVEDAAQALGAEGGGRRAGSLGAIGCFSFFPSKNLGAFGDAGLCTTGDEALAARLRLLRAHGSSPKYFHSIVGGNFRLDAVQAAVLLAKLPRLEAWTAARRANAAAYRAAFERAGLAPAPIALPPDDAGHAWNQFVIRTPRRDELMRHLAAREIQTEIYYPRPMHLQECFAALGHREGDFPVAEACARDALALPVHPELPAGAIDYVVSAIAEFHR
jgi:dTDP-4-amino-4,6-dideoxygalactose transaminase